MVFYKIAQAVDYMKNYSEDANHRDYDEEFVTGQQSNVKVYVKKSCIDILAHFCKVENEKTGEHPKLSKFLNHVKIGNKIFN